MSATLNHIAGPSSLPFVGHTLKMLRDAYGFHRETAARYGEVYKISLLGDQRVSLNGADALQLVFEDREQIFSSRKGWNALERLFPGGLLLQDFEHHRGQRRMMQAAFRAPALANYQHRMDTELSRLVADWPLDTAFKFHPAIKDMTLRMGAAVFMGLAVDDPRSAALNNAFTAEVAGSFGLFRSPLPFTKMGRGVAGRKFLIETFRQMIPERRASGGEDFFSQMCLATDEDGAGWSDSEIIDQFNLLMMAAHDTTASALTTMVWALVAYPEWQARLQAEVDALPHGPLTTGALSGMQVTERVFKEALRLVPPVPFVPRFAEKSFEYKGVTIPAKTPISVSPGMVMMSPDLYTAPETFDPDRFSANRAEDKRHRYAWTPFGGGAHKCIGMHFATLQVKLFIAALLRRATISAEGSTVPDWARMPMPQPKNGLPIRLHARA